MKQHTKIGQLFLHLFFIIFCLAYIIPFLLLISISISSESAIREYGYTILPKVVSFAAYKQIFANPNTMLTAYKTTLTFSLATTAGAILVTSLAAYPLSRPSFKFKKQFSFYLFFTMLFSGGLVPSYIINTNVLHLNDTIWIYILPGLVSAWNVIVVRTFFQGLPSELLDAAKIDGLSEMGMLFRIVLPLSTPVLATIGFMTLLGNWNNWNTSLIYIDNPKLYSLQYMLQRILNEAEFLKQAASDGTGLMDVSDMPTDSLKYAMAMVAAGPMLVVFPFFQKYFTQGLVVGSVKG